MPNGIIIAYTLNRYTYCKMYKKINDLERLFSTCSNMQASVINTKPQYGAVT